MILNHLRQSVKDYVSGDSFCPECRSLLIAKRGTIVIWHWAHKASDDPRPCSRHGETEWHLRMKSYCQSWPGWAIEHPLKLHGKLFFLDAYHRETNQVVEFIHSYNPDYVTKQTYLTESAIPVLWIVDGDQFVSSNRIFSKHGDLAYDFLKPKALELRGQIPFFVLYGNVFWKLQGLNKWSVVAHPVLDQFRFAINS